jgi:thioester reductase-like protein
VLIEYLNTETGTAYCLVRSTDEAHAYQRLLETLGGTGVESHLGTRIIPIAGNLQSRTPHQLPASINTVIHCAADTRHFAADNIIEDTNIYGTDRIISFCLAKSARLIHISTLSVALLPQEDADSIVHTGLSNPYIQSKAIAEQHILEAIAHHGLNATIMRIGNLATPLGQAHGGLLDTLDTFRFLGEYPQSLADLPIDLSPVHLTARAILLLAAHATNCTILHPYNPHTTTLGAYLQQHGNPTPVGDTQFQNTLKQAMNDPNRLAMLVPLLHYQAMKDTNTLLPTLPDNSQECQLLEESGFAW